MAVFSQYNTSGFSGDSIGIDESYTGANGLYRIMEESEINKHSIFEHVIGCDFMEASTNRGFMLESEMEAINEASGSGIMSKVIDFFKKLGEKIKGIIQNIMDRLTAVFTKDGKSLVNKFKKQINEKMNKGEYDEHFKYKWCKVILSGSTSGELNVAALGAEKATVAATILDCKTPKNIENITYRDKSIKDILGDDADLSVSPTNNYAAGNQSKSLKTNLGYARDAGGKDLSGANDATDRATRTDKLDKFNTDDKQKDYRTPIGTDDLKDYKDAILSSFVANTDAQSFAKDMDEKIFDSEDEKEGFTASDYQLCINILTDNKTLNGLEKEKRQVDKSISEIVKEAKKYQKEMDKLAKGKNYSRAAGLARAMSTTVISMGNVCTACSTMIYAAYTAAVKKNIKQARAVFVKAATYTKKKSANEAALYEAYAEVSDYEVDQMLPEF